ncbi:MAG: tRNA (adenosine(37)-N6)-threonylcarbamoyltransferase complex ATPase subunit type 1 TsaE [Pseudomonadota bacterium]
MTTRFEQYIPDETSMLAFGATLASVCQGTAVIFLYGELGAGKTTLARGVLRGLGYQDKVKSPTYTIVEPYEIADQKLYHFDFYRLQDAQDLEFIGVQDYFETGAIILAEWPERGAGLLREADLSCYIVPEAKGRNLRIEAQTPHGLQMLKDLHSKHGE